MQKSILDSRFPRRAASMRSTRCGEAHGRRLGVNRETLQATSAFVGTDRCGLASKRALACYRKPRNPRELISGALATYRDRPFRATIIPITSRCCTGGRNWDSSRMSTLSLPNRLATLAYPNSDSFLVQVLHSPFGSLTRNDPGTGISCFRGQWNRRSGFRK
jgi:hypothetical protein